MSTSGQFKTTLSLLGAGFSKAASDYNESSGEKHPLFHAIESSYLHNAWFIPDFVRFSFSAWAQALSEVKVEQWLGKYDKEISSQRKPLTVAIIMAGNIPLVGLHDLLCVLASGHNALIRLSSGDDQLIPAVVDVLCSLDPGIKNRVRYAEGPMKNFDAIIATGSNNASRYFDYYFGKYPGIIRRNRNGIAVLTGDESDDDLRRLADDIFIYFGLGCRNVSKIYHPADYQFDRMFPFFNAYAHFADLHKYRNNYDYQKSILLINRVWHLDNGFLLVKPDKSLISAVSVVNTEPYTDIETLTEEVQGLEDQIQCIVAGNEMIKGAIPFGNSQIPELWDYADGVDTMEFLLNL
jgi:hypothetical protein